MVICYLKYMHAHNSSWIGQHFSQEKTRKESLKHHMDFSNTWFCHVQKWKMEREEGKEEVRKGRWQNGKRRGGNEKRRGGEGPEDLAFSPLYSYQVLNPTCWLSRSPRDFFRELVKMVPFWAQSASQSMRYGVGIKTWKPPLSHLPPEWVPQLPSHIP